jgi:hypothetical protein
MVDNEMLNSTRSWKLGTGLATLIAIVTSVWGYLQLQRVEQLTAALGSQQTVVEQLRQELAARTNALQQETKRDLPVTVTFRHAFLGSGLVAAFKNNSAETLEMAAEFSSSATGQQREAHLVIQAGGAQEFGDHEGWAFSSGHHVKLSNAQFRPLELIVP